jgi:hypothetical protein
MEQKCNTCGDVKPLDEFPRNGKDKDGNERRRPDCNVCYTIKRKAKKTTHTKFLNNTFHRTGELKTLTFDDWRECLIFFKGACCYCGRKQSRSLKLTKDHLVAVKNSKVEGRTVKKNIVPACCRCNSSKSNTSVEEWYPRQRFYSAYRMERIRVWST